MSRYYLSDKQIVDRIVAEVEATRDDLHSALPGRNERAVRRIATTAWDCAVCRRRRWFWWWPW